MAKPSPCVKQCKLVGGHLCSGCLRTKHEIMTWKDKNMSTCLEIMEKLKGKNKTHDCPRCNKPAHCDIEAGKSGKQCWCMVEDRPDPDVLPEGQNRCMCRKCLVELALVNT